VSVVIIGALPGFRRPTAPHIAVFALTGTLFALAVRARGLDGTVPRLVALWELGLLPVMVSVFLAPALAVLISGIVLLARWLTSSSGRSPKHPAHRVETARPPSGGSLGPEPRESVPEAQFPKESGSTNPHSHKRLQ
jgi:hypothetical protein